MKTLAAGQFVFANGAATATTCTLWVDPTGALGAVAATMVWQGSLAAGAQGLFNSSVLLSGGGKIYLAASQVGVSAAISFIEMGGDAPLKNMQASTNTTTQQLLYTCPTGCIAKPLFTTGIGYGGAMWNPNVGAVQLDFFYSAASTTVPMATPSIPAAGFKNFDMFAWPTMGAGETMKFACHAAATTAVAVNGVMLEIPL
jgi:hypothetical protein